MKTDNKETLDRLIKELEELRKEIYDYDYDSDTLWLLDEALGRLRQI